MSTIYSAKTVRGTITTQNLVPAGTPTAASTVGTRIAGYGTATVQTVGTYTGALTAQVSVDGINWISLGGTSILNVNTGGFLATITSALQSVFQIDVVGFNYFRISANAAVTGSVVVSIALSEATALMGIDTALPAGTAALGSVTLGAPLTATTTSITKAEDAVHATADSGVMMLGVQYPTLTAPNAAGDYSFVQLDDLAKQVTTPYAPGANMVQGTTAAIVNTSDNAVIAAGAAGVRNYITSVTVTNSSAIASVVEVKDGSTVLARLYAPANGDRHYEFPIPLRGTAATIVNVACLTTATNTYITAVGFRAL